MKNLLQKLIGKLLDGNFFELLKVKENFIGYF